MKLWQRDSAAGCGREGGGVVRITTTLGAVVKVFNGRLPQVPYMNGPRTDSTHFAIMGFLSVVTFLPTRKK